VTSVQPVNTYFERLCTEAFIAGWPRLSASRDQALRGAVFQPARLLPIYVEEFRRRATDVLEAAQSAISRFALRHDEIDQDAWVRRAQELVATQAKLLGDEYVRFVAQRGFGARSDIFALDGPMQVAGIGNRLRSYFWDLQHLPPSKETPVTQNFNIQGPVGAIMTGANATANVSQTVAATDLSTAVEALLKLRAALTSEPAVSEGLRPELLDTVDKVTTELSSGQPALDRVMLWLGGIASIVQAIPALQPAWQAVKAAANTIGVPI
jgi:hypothetical protein